jgi:hypothetical protein
MWWFLLACVGVDPDPPGQGGTGTPACPDCCNRAVDLCDRTLDAITLLRTHNSHASEERGYHELARNHTPAIPTQLADGARSLNVDVHEVDGELVACHGYCELGMQDFDEVLGEIMAFLTSNPREVVLLDFENRAPAGAIQAAIEASGLADLALDHAPLSPWPTLGTMVDDGTRLVVFGDRLADDPDWFLDHNAHIFGTGWAYETPEELDCATAPIEHGLYEVTHVLTNPLAHPDNATLINPDLQAHIELCTEEIGHPVNLASVDYYTIGDTAGQVWAVNGL